MSTKNTENFFSELGGMLCEIGGSDGKVSACNAGDLGSIPGSGRSPGDWRIPWAEEPGGLQFMGLQRVGHD